MYPHYFKAPETNALLFGVLHIKASFPNVNTPLKRALNYNEYISIIPV